MPSPISFRTTTLDFHTTVSDDAWMRHKTRIEPLLGEAFTLAPQMAQVAVDRMTSLQCRPNFGALGAQGFPDSDYRETVVALYKYFNFPIDLLDLPHSDGHWSYVPRIAEVYQRTLAGLRRPHTIRLFSGKVSEHGYVQAGGGMDGALKAYFAQTPDAEGHVPFTAAVTTGDIHLNLDWLATPKLTADRIACTIVHEATHKWAYTTDECYKSSTIARRYKGKGILLKQFVSTGAQPTAQRPADSWQKDRTRAKPVVYAMAEEPEDRLKAGEAIPMIRWLRNADSYAWCARRLWKRAGRPADALDDADDD